MALEDKDYIKRQTELAAKGLKKFIDGESFEQLFKKEDASKNNGNTDANNKNNE